MHEHNSQGHDLFLSFFTTTEVSFIFLLSFFNQIFPFSLLLLRQVANEGLDDIVNNNVWMKARFFSHTARAKEIISIQGTVPFIEAILAKLVTTLKGHGLKEGKPRSGDACLFILQIKRGATWDDIRCEFWHRQA